MILLKHALTFLRGCYVDLTTQQPSFTENCLSAARAGWADPAYCGTPRGDQELRNRAAIQVLEETIRMEGY